MQVLPHQFVSRACSSLKDCINPNAKAISLIKGIHIQDSKPVLISDLISSQLGIDCSVLCGANIGFSHLIKASEIANQEFAESTLGYTNLESALLFKQVLETRYFRIQMVNDVAGVQVCYEVTQVCGAVKNIIAIAVGIAHGLELGSNTCAAIMRIGLLEIKRFSLSNVDLLKCFSRVCIRIPFLRAAEWQILLLLALLAEMKRLELFMGKKEAADHLNSV